MRAAGQFTYEASIPKSDLVDRMEYFVEAGGTAGRRACFPREGANQPIRVRVTRDDEAPSVAHQKVRHWKAAKPLVIDAEVDDPSGVESVWVLYRGVSQHQDLHRLRMLPIGRAGRYRAEIPGSDLDPRWDFTYLIETFDAYGNGRIYPDLEKEILYVVVRLQEQAAGR